MKTAYTIPHYRDFKETFVSLTKSHGDDIAFSFFRDTKRIDVNYKTLASDIFSLGSYFMSIGLNNARIALYAENSYEWIVTYFAAIISDNAIMPLDKELKTDEAATLYKSGKADMLVYSNKKSALAEALSEELTHSLCLDNFGDAVKKGGSLIYKTKIKEITADIEKPCTYIFTSGTTGTPKCVMLCQRNLMADIINSIETLYFPKGTVCLLPLNHTFGMMACIMCQLYVGFPIFINGGLKYIMRDIKEASPRHISVVPLFIESFYKSIWKNAKKSGKEKALKNLIKVSNGLRKIGIDMRRTLFKSVIDGFGGKLELLISGGAPISPDIIKGLDDFGIEVVNGFGITECSPIVTLCSPEKYTPGCIGVPIKHTEVKTIDNNADGEGELCVKGDIVMLGYFDNPEANAKAFQDGWFLTGDIGRIGKNGLVYVTGRKKNLILLDNGKNVYPEELEYLIGKIDGVTEVLVYSEDDTITAEIYAEDIEKKDAIIDEIKNGVNPTIAQYKQIRKIKFRNSEFAKTSTKKIKR